MLDLPSAKMPELVYTNLTLDLAARCAQLELAAFPGADPDELLSEADIEAYARTFPEGFYVALDGETVVGQGAGIFFIGKIKLCRCSNRRKHQKCENRETSFVISLRQMRSTRM